MASRNLQWLVLALQQATLGSEASEVGGRRLHPGATPEYPQESIHKVHVYTEACSYVDRPQQVSWTIRQMHKRGLWGTWGYT